MLKIQLIKNDLKKDVGSFYFDECYLYMAATNRELPIKILDNKNVITLLGHIFKSCTDSGCAFNVIRVEQVGMILTIMSTLDTYQLHIRENIHFRHYIQMDNITAKTLNTLGSWLIRYAREHNNA